jgi:dolichol-phosphate mannosyltransferase
VTGTGSPGAGPLVVVLSYKERETLPAVIDGIRRHLPAAYTLVVDDTSPDGTASWPSSSRPPMRSAGCTVRPSRASGPPTGRGSRGVERGCSVFVEMTPTCRTTPPRWADCWLAWTTRTQTSWSAVATSPSGAIRNWPLRRRVLSAAGNAYVRAWTRVPVRDTASGFRVSRREVLERLYVGTLRSGARLPGQDRAPCPPGRLPRHRASHHGSSGPAGAPPAASERLRVPFQAEPNWREVHQEG